MAHSNFSHLVKHVAAALVFGWASLLCWAQPNPPSGVYLEDLRVWLKSNWYDGYHSSLGYNEGRRQMYGYTDILSNGNIEGIYTGFQQAGGFVTYPNPINAEHIVPQSFWKFRANAQRHLHLRPAMEVPTARAAIIHLPRSMTTKRSGTG